MPVCAEPGCPALTDRGVGRCPTHTRAADRARGTPAARGYDAAHTRARARLAPAVATGTVTCWRCGELIAPTDEWDLGHDDYDRTITRGPEHRARCNRAAAGRKAHR